MPTADGWYYAIKGFAFQIDKAILDILNCPEDDKVFNIEQIQDAWSEDYVMQIKYKEAKDYSDVAIREPVVQLIEEFKKDRLKKYKLYCHFRNKTASNESVDISKLNSILSLVVSDKKWAIEMNSRINGFDDTLRRAFLEKFELIFAPTFQDQFEQALIKLGEQSFVWTEYDERIFYYENIVGCLRRIVVNNPDPSDRIYTKSGILNWLQNGRRLIFNSSFLEYKGEVEFIKFVKAKFVKLDKKKRNFIVLWDVWIDSSVSLDSLILDLVNHYFKNATHDIEPLTIISKDEHIHEIKCGLIREGICFNDWYETINFDSKMFFRDPIRNKKIGGKGRATESLWKISFELRIVSLSKFQTLTEFVFRPHVIYYLNTEPLNNIGVDIPVLKVDWLNTKQLLWILTL